MSSDPYQQWALVVVDAQQGFEDPYWGVRNNPDCDRNIAALVEAFHSVHERVFAVKEPGQHIECLYWKGRATASLPKPELRRLDSNGAEPRPDGGRPAWWGPGAPVHANVYLGETIPAGRRITGPAIVEEPTTTIVVHPGWSLTVGDTGDYLLERELQENAR